MLSFASETVASFDEEKQMRFRVAVAEALDVNPASVSLEIRAVQSTAAVGYPVPAPPCR